MLPRQAIYQTITSPSGVATENWNVLFLCPRCAFVARDADGERETKDVDQDPNTARSHLYSLSFPCGYNGCSSQVTVYTSALGVNKGEREARTKSQKEEFQDRFGKFGVLRESANSLRGACEHCRAARRL